MNKWDVRDELLSVDDEQDCGADENSQRECKQLPAIVLNYDA